MCPNRVNFCWICTSCISSYNRAVFNEGKHPAVKGISSLPNTDNSYETLRLPGTFPDCGFSSSFVCLTWRRVLPAEHYLLIRTFLPSIPCKETAERGGNCHGFLLHTQKDRKRRKEEIAREHLDTHTHTPRQAQAASQTHTGHGSLKHHVTHRVHTRVENRDTG